MFDTFRSILDNIHQYLFQQCRIKAYRFQLRITFQPEKNIPVVAHTLHKAFTRGSQFIQFARNQGGLRNFHNIGKTGDKAAHGETTFGTNAHHIADILHILFGGKGLFHSIKGRCNTRRRIVHFVRNHADHLLIRFLFSTHHLVRHLLYQIERMMKTSVDKGGMGTFIDIRVIQTHYCRLIF